MYFIHFTGCHVSTKVHSPKKRARHNTDEPNQNEWELGEYQQENLLEPSPTFGDSAHSLDTKIKAAVDALQAASDAMCELHDWLRTEKLTVPEKKMDEIRVTVGHYHRNVCVPVCGTNSDLYLSQTDHCYAKPTDEEVLKKKIKHLQNQLAWKEKRVTWSDAAFDKAKKNCAANHTLDSLMQGSFSGLTLDLLRHHEINKKRPKTHIVYSKTIKEFAHTCNFYSPRTYDFLRSQFQLPHPNTLSAWRSGGRGSCWIFT